MLITTNYPNWPTGSAGGRAHTGQAGDHTGELEKGRMFSSPQTRDEGTMLKHCQLCHSPCFATIALLWS